MLLAHLNLYFVIIQPTKEDIVSVGQGDKHVIVVVIAGKQDWNIVWDEWEDMV